MFWNVKSYSKLWITTRAHHNVSLRSGKKNSDIIKCDSDINEGVLHNGNRFQSFVWQYQGVTTNKCDIIKVKLQP